MLAAGVDSDAGTNESLQSLRTEDLDLVRYAQDFLLRTCIVDNGYSELGEYVPETVDPLTQEQFNITAATFLYSSEADARSRGFGLSEPASPDKYYAHDDGAYGAVFDTCDKLAWEELGEDGLNTFVDYNNLVSRVSGEAWTAVEEATPKLGAKLQACLTDKGAPVTDGGDYWGMNLTVTKGSLERPTTERPGPAKSSGIEVVPGEPENPYVPTAEESDLAADVYDCSNTTTVRADLDDLIQTALTDGVQANSQEISDVTERLSGMVDRAHELTGK